MASPSRRQFLLAAVAATAPLSGCSSPSESQARFHGLTLRNLDDTGHEVAVTMYRDDHVVAERSFALAPRNSNDRGRSHLGAIADGWDDATGRFRFVATLDGGRGELDAKPEPPTDADCYGYEIRVTRGGHLSGWMGRHLDGCGSTTRAGAATTTD